MQEDDIKIQMYRDELMDDEEELGLDEDKVEKEAMMEAASQEEESPNAAPPIPNASSFFIFGPKNP